MRPLKRCPLKAPSFKLLSEFAILAALGLASCAKSRPPQTDDDLMAVFRRNKPIFENLVTRSFASPPDCGSKDPSICEPTGSRTLVNELSRQLGLPIQAAYIKRNVSNSLWIPGYRLYRPSDRQPQTSSCCKPVVRLIRPLRGAATGQDVQSSPRVPFELP
jgi:hypothetical protein